MQIKAIFVETIKKLYSKIRQGILMKILMILERDFPADDRVEKEALSLIKAGHKVELLCYTINGKDTVETYKGIRIIKRRISRFIYRSSVGALRVPFYFIYWQKRLSDLLKADSYDVLHLHDLTLSKVVYRLSRKYSCSFVLDLHENYPALLSISPHTQKVLGRLLHSNRQWEVYEQHSVAMADGLITVVNEMKERIRPFAKSSIAVVENTPYLEELTRHNVVPDKQFVTLIYSGGITWHRGLQTVLEGLKLAVELDNRIRLIILGGGSYEQALKKVVCDYNLESHVVFMGWVTPGVMYEHIGKADIALIPHVKSVQSDNSSPNKLYQYMYYGKPILTSNCNSVERVIKETSMGLSYVHDSPVDFCNKLLKLIGEMPFDQYRLNGPSAIENKYNWAISVKELIELYKELASRDHHERVPEQ